MSWVECQLGDILTLKRGYDLPHTSREDGDIPVVSSSGITGYHNSAKVEGPAVVTGRYGTLGEVYYVEGACWPLNTALYVHDFKGNRPKFVYYFLQSVLKGMQSDKAAVPGVNRNDLHARRVKCTKDLNLQAAVEKFISPYDDLIANNLRRIQLLEESARLLYQEWFVQLRFPGHEQVKVTDGVPEGWEDSTLGSFASVQSGYAFKSKDWLEAGNPVIKIKNITGDGTVDIANCQCVDDNVADKAQKFKLEEDDFLIAMTGATVGKVGIMPRNCQPYYLNQRVGKFEFVGETSKEFVFCLTNSKHFRIQIENLAGGAAQPNISGKQIESIKILRPSEKLLSLFSEQSRNFFEQRQILLESNKKLTQARDVLLPKLMSGELTV